MSGYVRTELGKNEKMTYSHFSNMNLSYRSIQVQDGTSTFCYQEIIVVIKRPY